MYPEYHFNMWAMWKVDNVIFYFVFFIQNIQSLVCILHLELIPSRTKCSVVTISFSYLLISRKPKMTDNGVEKNGQKNYVNEYTELCRKKTCSSF